MSQSPYPKDIVHFRYSAMGGATGGLIVSIFLNLFNWGNSTTLDSIIGVAFLSLLFGSLIGFIPALCTG